VPPQCESRTIWGGQIVPLSELGQAVRSRPLVAEQVHARADEDGHGGTAVYREDSGQAGAAQELVAGRVRVVNDEELGDATERRQKGGGDDCGGG
jgi:hypothetical protein